MLADVMLIHDEELENLITAGCNDKKHTQEGVYIGPLNWNLCIPDGWIKDEYPHWVDESNYYGSYGVCDTPEQMLEKYDKFLNVPDRNFVVFFTLIRREDQSDWGGWKWHKWGEYIGNQNPTCEYLYDEKDINEVYVYHVRELVNPTPMQTHDKQMCELMNEWDPID